MIEKIQALEEELRELYFDMKKEKDLIELKIQHLEPPFTRHYNNYFQMEDRVIAIKQEISKIKNQRGTN